MDTRGQSEAPHVLIVGAGFGGLYAAKALAGELVRITVIDRRNHHLFQPLLYQVATAALSPGDIAHPIRAILSRQKNVRVLLAEASAVNLQSKKVTLRDGEITYDYLILATGVRHAYFGHNEWEKWAPGLKSLEDALEMRRRILLAFEKAEREPDEKRRRELLTFLIIGGGPTGVELAGAIAEISRQVMVRDFRTIDPGEAQVILVEGGPRVLPSYPDDLSAKAEKSLAQLGVQAWKGAPVTSISEKEVRVGDRIVVAGTTLWAAGVEASPLARSLGVKLDRAGRVLVEPDLTIPGHHDAFVIGDLADLAGKDGKPLPGVCPVAIQQGRHVAHNIRRACQGKPLRPFEYFDKGSLATIGRAAAVADFGWIKFSGFLAWAAWLFVHIFFLIGFRNRFVVMFEWAWAYFTFQRAARLITGDINARPSS
ncbi:MAG: NAD(P)/FAD-dependent oxidoreductase [Acidobacteria bacterium]|nr:NAD(P)/FAD-dependent oxidoreductase [Acidobacteriota bacterium]